MVANITDNSYVFSYDMPDIRITGVHGKLSLRMVIDGQEALSETIIRIITMLLFFVIPATSSMNISYIRNSPMMMFGLHYLP